MRIEKINDNQIRCFLTKEDLEARNLKLSELAYGSDKAKELFRELMRWAYYKFNFDADNIPLMIEAVPLSAESILLIVSKVAYPEEFDSRFSDFTESMDEGDWDDWDGWDESSGFPSFGGMPPVSPIPEKRISAHDVLQQYQSNATAMAAAEAALDALAGGVVKAAGLDQDGAKRQADGIVSDSPAGAKRPVDGSVSESPAGAKKPVDGSVSEITSGADDVKSLPPAVESADILPGTPTPVSKAAGKTPSGKNGSGKVKDTMNAVAMTPQAFAAALSSAVAAVRRGGTSGNYARMFAFDSIDAVSEAAVHIVPTYDGSNYLYKDANGVYHLIVTMENEEPVRYNKVVNMLTEFGTAETLNHETTSFMDEHDNLIIANNALQMLACL